MRPQQAVAVIVGEPGPWLDAQVAHLRQAWGAATSALSQRPDSLDPNPFDEEKFDAQAAKSAAEAINALRTVPMWGGKRLVWLRHAECLPAEEQAVLAGCLASPVPQTHLLITAAKLDGRSKLRQTAKKIGCLVEATAPSTAELRQMVQGVAAAHGKRCSPAAMTALLEALGDDAAALQDAAQRLTLFVGEAATIEIAAVEACVTRTAGESIWRLVDAVAQGDAAGTMRGAARLLADREPPLRILAMVTRQLRQLARLRFALQRGEALTEAAKLAGIPPFKAREMADAAKSLSEARLPRAFQLLAQTDRLLKSSRCPANLLLEQALLQLCTREHAG